MLIDVSRLVGRFLKGRLPTGIDRVCQAHLAHYGAEARALVRVGRHSLVFDERMSARMFQALQGTPTRTKTQYANRILSGIATGGLSRVPPGTVLFNPGHSGLESESYYRLIRAWKLEPVFMLHDLIPMTHPEYCKPGEAEKHLARVRKALEMGRGLITNSQATLDAVAEFAAQSGIELPPAAVALLGPGKPAHPVSRRPIREPYFVSLGTIEPRKNHLLLLQVWRRLVEVQGQRAPRLVLIGQRGWECENVVDLLERCEKLHGFVTEVHDCSDVELSTYLHHSQALLFPSFAEGFGMPLLEALAQGVPVIASALPVFKEFAGNIPEYIDPLDGCRWLEAILDFAEPHSSRRRAQLRRLENFEPPTWDAHFETVDTLLRRIGDHSSSAEPIAHPMPGAPSAARV